MGSTIGMALTDLTQRDPASYRDFDGNQWQGSAYHHQVDTGLGFTCDDGILDLNLALNAGKIMTLSSCEGPYASIQTPCAWVLFRAQTTSDLISFCVALKTHIHNSFCYYCEVRIESDARDETIRAHLYVPHVNLAKLVEAVNAVHEASRLEAARVRSSLEEIVLNSRQETFEEWEEAQPEWLKEAHDADLRRALESRGQAPDSRPELFQSAKECSLLNLSQDQAS